MFGFEADVWYGARIEIEDVSVFAAIFEIWFTSQRSQVADCSEKNKNKRQNITFVSFTYSQTSVKKLIING